MFKWLLCQFGVHKYYVIKEFKFGARRVGCRNCRQTWGMHDGVKTLIPWDRELMELHRDE